MILLRQHDSGVDGWDAHSCIVAAYESRERAIAALAHAGYTVEEHGVFHHHEHAKRWTMNAISYSMENVPYNEFDFS
jgi:hypothetical protein